MKGGNGESPVTTEQRLSAIESRQAQQEETDGRVLRELSEIRSSMNEMADGIATSNRTSRSAVEEVMGLRGELRDEIARRDRECDIRHGPVDRRLARLEDHDDTLTASSAMTYSEEALRKRYDAIKSDVSSLKAAAQANEAARVAAERSAAVQAQRARQAMWTALGTGIVAVAGVVAAALQAFAE
jgi:chromosome segregation ATPase